MHSFRKCDDDVTVFILGIPPLFAQVEVIHGKVEARLKDITVKNQVVPVLPSCPRIAVVSS